MTNDDLARVTLPHGTITYRFSGPEDSHRPPVVFVHGLLVDNALWAQVADLLAVQGIRSYAPTWPLGSHRIPMNPDADLSPLGMAGVINDFIGALGLDDVTLVGCDTGGALCQFTIDSDHIRIGRLVLTNCDAFELFPPPAFAPVAKLGQHPGLLRIMMAALTIAPIRRSKLGYGQVFAGNADAGITRRWIEPALRNAAVRRDVAKLLHEMKPEATQEIATRFSQFTKPVHLIWGDDDAFFPVKFAERLAEAFPDTSLTVVPGGRTFVAMDQPDVVATVIANASR